MRVGNGNVVPRWRPFPILLFVMLLAWISIVTDSAAAETVWTGPPILFVKPDFADPALPSSRDAIVPDVHLTRANNRGLYNIAVETFFTTGASPAGTEWAWVLNNPALDESAIHAANHASLHFDDWTTAHGSNPSATLGRPGVLHLIASDVYIDITMTAWTSSAAGGGFAYTRSTPSPVPVPSMESLGTALMTIGISIGAGVITGRSLGRSG